MLGINDLVACDILVRQPAGGRGTSYIQFFPEARTKDLHSMLFGNLWITGKAIHCLYIVIDYP